MIHELRVAHFRTFAVLGIVLPAGILAAIVSRTEPPRVDALPEELARAAGWDGAAGAPLWHREDLFGSPRLAASLVRDDHGALALVLQPLEEPRAPDLLVYWAGGAEPSGTLPADAVWLGVLAGTGARAFPLPEAASKAAGRIVLYSLAHATLVDEVALPGAP